MVLPKSPSRTFSLDYLRQTLSSLRTIIVTDRNNGNVNIGLQPQQLPLKMPLLTQAGSVHRRTRGMATSSFNEEDEDGNNNDSNYKG